MLGTYLHVQKMSTGLTRSVFRETLPYAFWRSVKTLPTLKRKQLLEPLRRGHRPVLTHFESLREMNRAPLLGAVALDELRSVRIGAKPLAKALFHEGPPLGLPP